VTALFPVDVGSDGDSALDFDDESCAVWYAGGASRLGDAAASIYDVRCISPLGHAPPVRLCWIMDSCPTYDPRLPWRVCTRINARDACLGRPFAIPPAWRDGNGMLFPVFDRLVVAHAELIPSSLSPLHIWLIDSGSSNPNVVSSIPGCWVRTSDVHVSLRRLSGISGAKSGRECTVHLMFRAVPLDVRVLEVPSCPINILSHSALEAAIGTPCQLNYIKTSTQHVLRITRPDGRSVVLPVSPDGLLRLAVSAHGSVLQYVKPSRSKAVYAVSTGAGPSGTLPEVPLDRHYEAEGQWEWGAGDLVEPDVEAMQRIAYGSR
jgi:hypothetical protein